MQLLRSTVALIYSPGAFYCCHYSLRSTRLAGAELESYTTSGPTLWFWEEKGYKKLFYFSFIACLCCLLRIKAHCQFKILVSTQAVLKWKVSNLPQSQCCCIFNFFSAGKVAGRHLLSDPTVLTKESTIWGY